MPNHQIGSQMKGSIPSRISMSASRITPSNQLVIGAEPDDRQGLAQVPVRIGAGAFVARKPIRQQNCGRRKHSTLGHPEEEPHGFEVPERLRKSAPHGANAPNDRGTG